MTYTYDDYVIDIDKLKNLSDKEIEAILDNLVYKVHMSIFKDTSLPYYYSDSGSLSYWSED